MRKKKREFTLGELLPKITPKRESSPSGATDKIKSFLDSYLDASLREEITSIQIKNQTLEIRISSPLLKNDFRLRNRFFLSKFQGILGENQVKELKIL